MRNRFLSLGLLLVLSTIAACSGASSKGNGITACTVIAEDASDASSFAVGNDVDGYTAEAFRSDGSTLVELTIPNSVNGSLGTYARYDYGGNVVASATIDLQSGNVLSSSLRTDDAQLLALIESRTTYDSAIGDSSRVSFGLELFERAAATTGSTGPAPLPTGDSASL